MDVLTYENMVDSQQIKVQKSCPSFPQLLQNAPLTVSKDDWNRRFQDALADIRSLAPNTRQTERKTVYTRLAHLSEDFVYTAETYGKIIISEVFLPPHCKTIPPLHGQGIAGGDKYVVNGIYFKFAVNSNGLYEDDDAAAKVAGHELKTLTQVFNCWIRGLHIPMTALVDYRGYRLIAMSVLPIAGAASLVYGSSNAGRTIHLDDPLINERMKLLGSRLNLKPHDVGDPKHPQSMYTCVDLEGHVGSDGKFYCLDFSRLFPPERPCKKKSAYLYRLLRPEFVKAYSRPLCSDAYSNFIRGHEGDHEHNKDIDEATDTLFTHIIPSFAEKLLQVPLQRIPCFPLVESLHLHGINCRYLGKVWFHLDQLCNQLTNHENPMLRTSFPECSALLCREWKFWLLLNMIGRVVKQRLRRVIRTKMRELKQSGEGVYRRSIVTQLNLFFGCSKDSTDAWDNILFPTVADKFPGVFGGTAAELKQSTWLPGFKAKFTSHQSSSTAPNLQHTAGIITLLCEHVCKAMGIVVHPAALQQLASYKIISTRIVFDETDIVEMFNEENGKFETLSQKIMVGRSRAACVSVSKAFIRELGFNCF